MLVVIIIVMVIGIMFSHKVQQMLVDFLMLDLVKIPHQIVYGLGNLQLHGLIHKFMLQIFRVGMLVMMKHGQMDGQ
jgi:hypothetical protein